MTSATSTHNDVPWTGLWGGLMLTTCITLLTIWLACTDRIPGAVAVIMSLLTLADWLAVIATRLTWVIIRRLAKIEERIDQAQLSAYLDGAYSARNLPQNSHDS